MGGVRYRRPIAKVGQRRDIKLLTAWRWLAEPRALRGVINVVKSGQQLQIYRDMALRSGGVSRYDAVRVGSYPHNFSKIIGPS